MPSKLSLSLRRRSDVGQLLAVAGNSATYEVEVENAATKQRVEVIPPRTLEGADSWTAKTASLDPSQLKIGQRYRIRIASTYSAGATVLPGGSADYDNVVLLARRSGSGGGGTGGGGSQQLTSNQLRRKVLIKQRVKAGGARARVSYRVKVIHR